MNAPSADIVGNLISGGPLAPSLERRRIHCYLVLLLCDAAAIALGLFIIGWVAAKITVPSQALIDLELVLLTFFAFSLYQGAYSIAALQDAWTGIFRAVAALGMSAAVTVFLRFMIRPEEDVSRVALGGGALLAMVLIVGGRLGLRRMIRRRCGATAINQLILDDGGPRIELNGAIHVYASSLGLVPNLHDPAALDRLGLALRNIDRVVVSCPSDRRVEWALMLKGANVEGEVLDDEVVRLGAQGARVVDRHGLLLVSAGPLGIRDRMIKRMFDMSFAGAAILALLPLFTAVAMAVKLEDRGPILFSQRRMGRGNRYFNIYKFRSMSQALGDATGSVSASKDDKRITRVGRFIRKTSIDELPQLFNVLLGDMSLIGPRPHATGSLAGDKLFWEVDARYWQRHSLKPGLSGLAQVRGFRGATDTETDLKDRLQADLEYLEGWTIMRDLQILFLTARVLVHDRAF